MKPEKVVIICPVTRLAVKKLFYELDALICDRANTRLVLYVDTGNPTILDICNQYKQYQGNFEEIVVEKSGNETVPHFKISRRRDRIAQGKEDCKKFIGDADYVMGIEDDCRIPKDAMQRLLGHIQKKDVGFVQGVQVGRWYTKYIGAWKFDNLYNPSRIYSLPYRDAWSKWLPKHLEDIDGGGFYCYMTKASLYKDADYKWKDPLGPDVWYGVGLRKKGYKCLMDWGLVIGHDTGEILYPDDKVKQVVYNKDKKGWSLESWTTNKRARKDK